MTIRIRSRRRPPNEWLITEGRETTAEVRPRCRMRAWIGHAVARGPVAGRVGRSTSDDSAGPCAVDGRGGGLERRRAHRLGEGRCSRRGHRGLRHYGPGGFIVRPGGELGGSDGPAARRPESPLVGVLFMVGHRPIDPETGAETAAAGQRQVSVDAATAALDPNRWTFLVAEDRPRPWPGPASTRSSLRSAEI